MNAQNFTLRFGKYKGQEFANTPKSYQDWLMAQDWFKMPSNQVRYDVVRKFVSEYARGMGIRFERVVLNLTWDEAVQYKDNMNLYQLDDVTEYFYIETTTTFN